MRQYHQAANRSMGLALLVLAFCAFAPARAQADTIFDNIHNSLNPICCGYAVGLYPGSTTVFVDAYPFIVPTGSSYLFGSVGLLESINTSIGPAPGGLSLFLYTNSGGMPGTVLASWTGVVVPSSLTLVTVSAPPNIVLQAGQQYWFGVTTTNPSQTAIWWINPALATSNGCASANGGAFSCLTNAAGAFQVTGTPTPEPASIVLFGSGLLALGGALRRKWLR